MKAFDIVIVGAGPAGMAAAVAAAGRGRSIAVIDDNQAAGGQIWRGGWSGGDETSALFRRFEGCGAERIFGARVVDADAREQTLTIEAGRVEKLRYSRLILATGARELFLPFPGWTLPHVFGVGGLQALAKSGLDVSGKRIIVAGTGPLLLAVAAYLQQHGARVPLIAEQASWGNLRRFGGALLRHPGKIGQALQIKKAIPGTRYLADTWVVRAAGEGPVSQVTLMQQGKEVTERCDYLAVAYGFVPNTELAQLLGCRLTPDRYVAVDEFQHTSVPGIYCAGEPTGLGGVDESLLEGELAGCAASGRGRKVRRRSTDHFSRALTRAFALRKELKECVTPATIVCRCEDVPFGRLLQARNWREAKLHYRCGMGPCQGRVCGPAVEFLLGWKTDSVRPPIFPTALRNLIQTDLKETIHS